MFKSFRSINTIYKVIGGGSVLGLSHLGLNQIYNPIYLDDLINSVIVDNGISPFPKLINDFKMLGSGIRTVTFLKFKVYGIGIYYNKKEELQLIKILKQNHMESSPLKQQLDDDDQSRAVLDKLITNHEYLVRISPVRNTDFNHLKDGFIKSILAHPLTNDHDRINQGLDELRQVFKGYKGSVPKNHVLLLVIDKQGQLTFKYENPTTKSTIDMGIIKEPLISKLLLVGYLGHKKPLSEPLRVDCNQRWLELME